jgi:hypothetical protein
VPSTSPKSWSILRSITNTPDNFSFHNNIVVYIPYLSLSAEYLAGRTLRLVTITLALGMFMVGIDISIISAVTPRVTDTFRSMDDIVRHGFVYRLLYTKLPSVGRLLQYLEDGRVFFVSLFIFGSNAVKMYFTIRHPKGEW